MGLVECGGVQGRNRCDVWRNFCGERLREFPPIGIRGSEKHLKSPTLNFAALPPESGLSYDLKAFSSILVDNSGDPTRACILGLLN